MIHRKESATEIAMRLRLGIPPLRPLVWIESIDAIAIETGTAATAKQGAVRSMRARAEGIAQPPGPESLTHDR